MRCVRMDAVVSHETDATAVADPRMWIAYNGRRQQVPQGVIVEPAEGLS